MVLFEKSLIDAYCNRLYDLGKTHENTNSPGKTLNVTNINTTAGPPNRQIGLPPNSLFLYESKRPSFGQRHHF